MKSRPWLFGIAGGIIFVAFIGFFVRWKRDKTRQVAVTPHPKTGASKTTKSNAPTFGTWFAEASRRLREYDREHPRQNAPRVPQLAVWDAEKLANHPAWQLAARLSGSAPVAFTNTALTSPNVNAPALFGARGDLSGLGRFALENGTTVTLPNDNTAIALNRWLEGNGDNGVTIQAQALAALQARAQQQQQQSINGFLLATAAQQQQRRAQLGDTLNSALRDDVDLARHFNPGALEPFMPSDSEALRLINLRLDLLRALRTTLAQKQAAADERLRLETEFRAALRQQELERRRLLEELQTTLPNRLAAQREAERNTTLREAALRDERQRETTIANQRELLAQDFTAQAALLGIVLPPRASNQTFMTRDENVASTSAPNSNRTRSANLPSNAAIAVENGGAFAPPSGNFAPLDVANTSDAPMRARALAAEDAQQWQRIAARRRAAWQNAAQPSKAGKKTRENTVRPERAKTEN